MYSCIPCTFCQSFICESTMNHIRQIHKQQQEAKTCGMIVEIKSDIEGNTPPLSFIGKTTSYISHIDETEVDTDKHTAELHVSDAVCSGFDHKGEKKRCLK